MDKIEIYIDELLENKYTRTARSGILRRFCRA